jgi:hypothetical protein
VSTQAPDLAERYGRPPAGRRPLVVVGIVLLLVVALAWVVWASVGRSRPEVTSQLVGYQIDGQHAATARFTVVRRDTDVAASCVLQAYADDHSVVGELTVPVSSGPTSATLSSRVRTERRATTVDLAGCTAPGQKAAR